jgi:MFS family permease
MIDLGLFRRRSFSTAIAAGLLSYLILFAVLFLVPFFLEKVHHLSPVQAGAVLSVLPIALSITAPFAGRARDRVGARIPTVAGMLLTALCLIVLTFTGDNQAVLVIMLAGIGVGLGAFTPANNAAIMSAAPARQSGMAGGILNLTRGLGTSLGVAIVGLILGLQTSQNTSASASDLTTGFQISTAVLALIALAAAALAASRRDPPPRAATETTGGLVV